MYSPPNLAVIRALPAIQKSPMALSLFYKLAQSWQILRLQAFGKNPIQVRGSDNPEALVFASNAAILAILPGYSVAPPATRISMDTYRAKTRGLALQKVQLYGVYHIAQEMIQTTDVVAYTKFWNDFWIGTDEYIVRQGGFNAFGLELTGNQNPGAAGPFEWTPGVASHSSNWNLNRSQLWAAMKSKTKSFSLISKAVASNDVGPISCDIETMPLEKFKPEDPETFFVTSSVCSQQGPDQHALTLQSEFTVSRTGRLGKKGQLVRGIFLKVQASGTACIADGKSEREMYVVYTNFPEDGTVIPRDSGMINFDYCLYERSSDRYKQLNKAFQEQSFSCTYTPWSHAVEVDAKDCPKIEFPEFIQ